MNARALAFALALTGCMAHPQAWHKRDIALGAVYLAASTVDMLQTRHITAACRENNPIMGECGERLAPEVWFPLSDFLGYVILDQLPSSSRGWILGLASGFEIKAVQRNWMLGDRP